MASQLARVHSRGRHPNCVPNLALGCGIAGAVWYPVVPLLVALLADASHHPAPGLLLPNIVWPLAAATALGLGIAVVNDHPPAARAKGVTAIALGSVGLVLSLWLNLGPLLMVMFSLWR